MTLRRCCCSGKPSCIIFKDNFDRANNSDIGSFWVEVSGNAAIAQERLASNVSGAFLVRTGKKHDSEKMSVTAEIYQLTTIGTVSYRYLVNYKDADNYLAVQFDYVYSGLAVFQRLDMRFYRRSGGADTQLGTTRTLTATTGALTKHTVCYDGTYLWSSQHREPATKITDGFYAGLYFMGTGVGRFGSFRWYRWEPLDGCVRCEPSIFCNYCDTSSVPPYRWKVNLGAGGWTNGDCSACASVVGDYVLVYRLGTGVGVGFGGYCQWCYSECGFCEKGTHCEVAAGGGRVCEKAGLSMALGMLPGSTFNVFKWSFRVEIPSACCNACDAVRVRDPSYDPTDEYSASVCRSPTDEHIEQWCNCSHGNEGRRALYESSDMTSLQCDDSPVTLNKVADYDHYGSIPGKTARCGGALPASITMTSV